MVSEELDLIIAVVPVPRESHGALEGVPDLSTVPNWSNGGAWSLLVFKKGLGIV